MFRLLAFCLFLFHGTHGASVKARIGQDALEFFNVLGRRMASERIRDISIPQQSFSIVGQLTTVKNIKVENFEIPKLLFDFEDNTAILKAVGGNVSLSGDILVNMNVFGIFNPTTSLGFSAAFSKISSEIRSKFDPTSLNLSLVIVDCRTTFKDVNIDVSGGLLGHVVNTFSIALRPIFKSLVEEKACSMIERIVSEKINSKLAVISKRIPIGDGLPINIEYENITTALTRNVVMNFPNPTLSTKNSMEVMSDARILFSGQQCQSLPSFFFPDPNEFKMITLWVAEAPFNCFLESVYNAKQMTFQIDGGNEKAAKYLKTVCPESLTEKCIGSAFPEIAEHIGDTIVDVNATVNQLPRFRFSAEDGIQTSVLISVEILYQFEKLIEFEISVDIVGAPTISNNIITTNKIELRFSKVGNFGPERMNQLLPLLDSGFNKGLEVLEKGFPFPSLLGIKLAETSSIGVEDGYIRGDFNLTNA